MTDHLDWRDLLKRYMKAVVSDDSIVADRCADPSSFDGTEEECAAVWELFIEAHREEWPKLPDPITQEEADALEAAKSPYQRAKDRADYYRAMGDKRLANGWYAVAESRKREE